MSRTSDEFLRKSFSERNGIPSNAPLSSRPISGYLVHPDNPMPIGSAPNEVEAQGEIEVILRKDVAERTSYTRGDIMKTGGRLVPLTSDDTDDISDALSNADGKKARSAVADSVLGLLKARASKNFSAVQDSVSLDNSGEKKKSKEIIEAQILGGFDIDDIEGISYPYEKVLSDSSNEPISDIFIKLDVDSIMKSIGFLPEESKAIKGKFPMGIPETPAQKEIKAYRRMSSIREKMLKGTIEYVLFPRADGLDVDDPRTYDSSANAWDDIEQVLINRMRREVEASLSKELRNIRKPNIGGGEK